MAYADTTTRRTRATAAVHQQRMPRRTEVVWGLPTEQKLLALTFDDGPDPRYTGDVLDALAKAHAPATFFQVGFRAQAHPDLVRRIVAEGHEVGNHTWHHDDLSAGGLAQAREHLGRTSDVLTHLTGSAPTLMRPPWGRLNGASLQAIGELGLTATLWQQRFQARELDADANAAWVISQLTPGVIVLSHDGGPLPNTKMIAALPAVLTAAQEQGFRFVTVSEGLALSEAPPVRAAAAP